MPRCGLGIEGDVPAAPRSSTTWWCSIPAAPNRASCTCVEEEARRRGACKLTLEVLTGNAPAMRAYARVKATARSGLRLGNLLH